MIIYFSATGNNKYIAQRIQAVKGDRLVSVTDCMKNGNFELELYLNEDLGFVTPTYFYGIPSIVEDFIDKMNLITHGRHYIYHVLSFGTFTGSANKMLDRLLHKKGLSLDACYAVKMVDTWAPMFDLSDPEENLRQTEAADPKIDNVIRHILKKDKGDFNRNKGSGIISPVTYAVYRHSASKTSNFKVTRDCIGCGLCAEQCPVGAIKMWGDRPAWVKKNCTLCLGCLHRCPAFAIRYGDKTADHGQFVNPKVTL